MLNKIVILVILILAIVIKTAKSESVQAQTDPENPIVLNQTYTCEAYTYAGNQFHDGFDVVGKVGMAYSTDELCEVIWEKDSSVGYLSSDEIVGISQYSPAVEVPAGTSTTITHLTIDATLQSLFGSETNQASFTLTKGLYLPFGFPTEYEQPQYFTWTWWLKGGADPSLYDSWEYRPTFQEGSDMFVIYPTGEVSQLTISCPNNISIPADKNIDPAIDWDIALTGKSAGVWECETTYGQISIPELGNLILYAGTRDYLSPESVITFSSMDLEEMPNGRERFSEPEPDSVTTWTIANPVPTWLNLYDPYIGLTTAPTQIPIWETTTGEKITFFPLGGEFNNWGYIRIDEEE
jgi:hypothetical protein